MQPTHKADKQKFTHSHLWFILQLQPHGTLSSRGMLTSTVNFSSSAVSWLFFLRCVFHVLTLLNLIHKYSPIKMDGGVFNLHYASRHWQKRRGERAMFAQSQWDQIRGEIYFLTKSSQGGGRKTGHILTCNYVTLHFGRTTISECHLEVFFIHPSSMSF